MIAARPGLRVPGAWDGFELAVRAVLGQQITVSAAVSLAGKLVAAYGTPLNANARESGETRRPDLAKAAGWPGGTAASKSLNGTGRAPDALRRTDVVEATGVPGDATAGTPFDADVRQYSASRQANLAEATGLPGDAEATSRLTHVFPRPERIAAADLAILGMPRARARALSAIAAAVVADPQIFGPTRSLDEAVAQLRALEGIGEWTAHYIAMRAMREPDAFPAADIALLRAMADADGQRPTPRDLLERAERWRPWRAYAAQHLWAAAAATTATATAAAATATATNEAAAARADQDQRAVDLAPPAAGRSRTRTPMSRPRVLRGAQSRIAPGQTPVVRSPSSSL